MLTINQVSCIRDERILFEHLSFSLHSGDVAQIMGNNGAGKTSLLRIIVGLNQPDTGQIIWHSQSIHEDRLLFHHHLLYIGHQTGLKAHLTAVENLTFYCASANQTPDEEKIYHALKQVGLMGYEDMTIKQLSAGQQRRVALARLWLSTAKLWVLDEPLTAIDSWTIHQLLEQFKQHADNRGIVLFTSHQDIAQHVPNLRQIHLTNGMIT